MKKPGRNHDRTFTTPEINFKTGNNYMSLNASEIAKIEALLQSRLAAVNESVRDHAAKISREGVLERGGSDRGDESNQELETSLNLTQVGREVNEAELLNQALERLKQPDFDTCIDCGGTIGSERLLANPIAKRCLDCQNVRENDFDERDSTPSL
jgi:RNA polymerase-binding protein DksA